MITGVSKGLFEGFNETSYVNKGFVPVNISGSSSTVTQSIAIVPGPTGDTSYLQVAIGAATITSILFPFYSRRKDVGISVKMAMAVNSNNAQMGFFCRRKDSTHYLQALIVLAPGAHYVRLLKNIGAGDVTMVTDDTFTPVVGTAYTLMYRRIADEHYLYKDGVLLGHAADANFTGDDGPCVFELCAALDGCTIRFYSVMCWEEDTNVQVAVGVGNKAKAIKRDGTDLIAAASADSNGIASLDISALNYPIEGKLLALDSSNNQIDASILYSPTIYKDGLVPGLYCVDNTFPVKNVQWTGQVTLPGLSSYGAVNNPNLFYTAGLWHLFLDAVLTSNGRRQLCHFTNTTFTLTGWTKLADAYADAGGSVTAGSAGYADPSVFIDDDGTWIMALQHMTNGGGGDGFNSTIYIGTSADGTTWNAPVQQETPTVLGPESVSQWGGWIQKRSGVYYLYYEAADATHPLGYTDGARYICVATASTVTGPYTFHSVITLPYYNNDLMPRSDFGGTSAPTFLQIGNALFVFVDYVSNGKWCSMIGSVANPYRLVLRRESFNRGIGLAADGAQSDLFSTQVLNVGGRGYGCCHGVTAAGAQDVIFLFTCQLARTAGGGFFGF